MKVRFSLRALLLFVTVLAVCLGWYGYQREHFNRELTAANWLRNERGAKLGWFKWDDELPLTAHTFSSGWDYAGKTVPAWDRSEWFHGRLHKPVNWCRLHVLLKDGALQEAEIDARCVEELKQLKYLEHLYIDTAEGHKHVDIPYGDFSNLEYLEVVGDVPLSKREIASIAQMYHLRSLVLEDTQLDDEALSLIGNLHRLRRLNVYSPLISNEGLASIQNLEFLQDLALDGEAITDDGLIHLSDMRSLSQLYLGNTGIRGIGFEALKGGLLKSSTSLSQESMKRGLPQSSRCSPTSVNLT